MSDTVRHGHDAASGTGGRAELECPINNAFVAGRQLLEQLLLQLQEPLGGRVQTQAGLGRLDAPPGTVEQLPSEPLLERADLQADGRLGHAEPLGGLGEALALDDGAERSQLARIHKDSGD